MIETLLQAERLLLHGLLDQAEDLYRRTLQADPRNAIALVGLSRIALERGDERGAYGHVCSALAIDARNPAALRLEARLSEIIATRGEAVERPAWLVAEGQPASDGPATPSEAAQSSGAEPPSAAETRPSEQAVFARNPSMADHRRVDEQRQQGRAAPGDDGTPERTTGHAVEQPGGEPGRGILRRLLGR